MKKTFLAIAFLLLAIPAFPAIDQFLGPGDQIYIDNHAIYPDYPPLVKAGPAAGHEASIVIYGNDSAGTISVTVGYGPSNGGTLITVIQRATCIYVPHVQLQAETPSAAAITSQVVTSYLTRNSWQIFIATGALVRGTRYQWSYSMKDHNF